MISFLSAKAVQAGYFEEQITGGRHPSDDKRYTIGMYVAGKIRCQVKPGFTQFFSLSAVQKSCVTKIGAWLFYFTQYPPPTATPRKPHHRLLNLSYRLLLSGFVATTVSIWPGKQSLPNIPYFFIFRLSLLTGKTPLTKTERLTIVNKWLTLIRGWMLSPNQNVKVSWFDDKTFRTT